MKGTFHIICIGLVVSLVGLVRPAAGGYITLDTFDDDTIGQFPNGPEIGNGYYTVWSGVTHQIASTGGGDLLLYTVDSATDKGIQIQYPLSPRPAEMMASWQFMIVGGATLDGDDAVRHTFNFEAVNSGSYRYLSLLWGADGQLRVQDAGGGDPEITYDTGFMWSTATYYDVAFAFSAATDTFSVAVNGTPVMTDQSFLSDIVEAWQLILSSSWPTTCSQRLDDVAITPEPATLGLLGLGGLALLKRKKT